MLTQHIALVPEADNFDLSELLRVSAALQKQVTRDIAPIWQISATVDPFTRLEDVPIGYVPIMVSRDDLASQAVIYVDKLGYPFAQIGWSRDWSAFASRACVELLVNPYEQRTVTALSPRASQGPVEFLVEPCAPSAHARYLINDVLVADFATPEFFSGPGATLRYSYLNALRTPLRPEPGGHITWFDPIGGSLWLRSHYRDNPIDTQLGPLNRRVTSIRELVQACTALRPQEKHDPVFDQAARAAQGQRASQLRAQRLRAQIAGPLEAEIDAAIERLSEPPPRVRTRPSSAPPPAPLPVRPGPRIATAEVVRKQPEPRKAIAEQPRSRTAAAAVAGASAAALIGLAWQTHEAGREASRGAQSEATAIVASAASVTAAPEIARAQPAPVPPPAAQAPAQPVAATPASPAMLTNAVARSAAPRAHAARPRASVQHEPERASAPPAPPATVKAVASLDTLLDKRE